MPNILWDFISLCIAILGAALILAAVFVLPSWLYHHIHTSVIGLCAMEAIG
jgi:hypothetical protein